MESKPFDHVKFEKDKAIARFRQIAKLWQLFEILSILALISYSSTCLPSILKISGEYVISFSNYLFNHHVVFLIGNVVIELIFTLCRENDSVDRYLYDDYVEHSRIETTLPPVTEIDDGKQLVVVDKEVEKAIMISQCDDDVAVAITFPKCDDDDVVAAIEKATRQIRRFQRTQSEKLKREICASPRAELGDRRRSELERSESEIERLSNEEFQRTVDEFINKHWSKRKTVVN